MSGLSRRVRAERDLWKAVWQQVETFLDRIDSTAEQDATHVRALAMLLPVCGVIERARKRAVGYGLGGALPAAPRGAGLGSFGGALFDPTRLPGVEECELACAPYYNKDSELGDDPSTLLYPSVVLAKFRDEKRADDVELVVPAYDFGKFTGTALIAGAAKQGLFPRSAREKAIEGESFSFTAWSALRQARLDKLRDAYDAEAAPSLSARLAALSLGEDPLADFVAVGTGAAAAAAACRSDRGVLLAAHQVLTEDGADATLLGRLMACADLLHVQAADYDWCAERLTGAWLQQLAQKLPALRVRLARADQPGGAGLPDAYKKLDSSAAETLDRETEARIAYPDGPLRMLRMLEQSLRFFWTARSVWMNRRHAFLTRPLLAQFFAPFVDSLAKVKAGQGSGLAVPAGAALAAMAQLRHRELRLTAPVPAVPPPAGRLAYVAGDRPTAAVVLDAPASGNAAKLQDDREEREALGGARLETSPLAISIAAGAELPGLPGIAAAGAPVRATFPAISDAEWRAGASAHGPAADGVIEALVAHASRLALVLGASGGSKDRPDAPAIPAPYPSVPSFALVGPVSPSATRLFLEQVPAASASGANRVLPVARPGELVLLRGADADGQWWQAVVEVDRAEVVTGAAARADDVISATAAPFCCADDEPVMIVHVRSMQLPGEVTLVRGIRLHRDFRGFGLRSLLAGAVLPETLDGFTATVMQQDGGATRTVLRDPELKTAVKIFEDWLGQRSGAAP